MWLQRMVVRVSTVCGLCAFGFVKLAAGAAVTLHVVNGNAAIMSRPALKSEEVSVVAPDAVLEVIGNERGWFWVLLPRDANGTRRAGWIREDEVEVLTGEAPLRSDSAPDARKRRQNDRQLKRAKQSLDKAKREYEKLTAAGSPHLGKARKVGPGASGTADLDTSAIQAPPVRAAANEL